MYIARQQYKGVMLILAWNVCNDIFDTRQSKRIFPLITAGGILGRILGSFSTNLLSHWTRLDNLLLVSAGLLILGAWVSHRTGQIFSPLVASGSQSPEEANRASPIAGIKEMSLLVRGSLLFLLLAGIRILPNVIGPMFDFQYGVILDQSIGTESGLIRFYGGFRGAMNVITFGILLFVGTVYKRVGLPNALLFRPGNYFLAFSLLLFRFDLLVGVYARISISVFTMTLHNPARNTMINLFPDAFRAKIRPLLQVASRAGSLIGSLILVGLKPFIDPRFFSLFGLCFASLWILLTLRLKRDYPAFLLEGILRNHVDLQGRQEMDLRVLARDKKSLSRLLQGLREEEGEAATLCGRILAEARYPELGRAILSVLPAKDLSVQVSLLDLLRLEDGPSVVSGLLQMADEVSDELRPHLVRTAARLAPKEHIDFFRRTCQVDQKAVQAEAIVGLYRGGKGSEGYPVLQEWLERGNREDRLRAIQTIGRTGDGRFEKPLGELLSREDDPQIQAAILQALGRLGRDDHNEQIGPYCESSSPIVRQAAVSALDLDDPWAPERAIHMLGDDSLEVRETALNRIGETGKQALPPLLRSLGSANQTIKTGVLQLLEHMEVKDVAFSQFVKEEIRSVFWNLSLVQRLEDLEKTPGLELLIQHLGERNAEALFTVFRILEVQRKDPAMRTIYHGLKSSPREKANALEALESLLHPSLSRVLIPLLDDRPPRDKLRIARKYLRFNPDISSPASTIFEELLDSPDSVAQMCALYVIGKGRMSDFSDRIRPLQDRHPDPDVRATARQTLERLEGPWPGAQGDALLAMDKAVRLKGIGTFSDLPVSALAAIGSVAEEQDYPKGRIVVREGTSGDSLFLVVSGEVSIIRKYGTRGETPIARISQGRYFGEMALFEDRPR
jgi:HEAT repeat protein